MSSDPSTGPDAPGVGLERLVAAIQAQFDPAAEVKHNEVLVDRLGQSRQFDVVVRGTFAGQNILGVIECKDLSGRVGTPHVDAFVTKAQDVNANLKILVSRRGFSKPALQKCAHYGIQALSLLPIDESNRRFFVGVRWEADVIQWGQVAVTLHFVNGPSAPVHFDAGELTVRGKHVLDWLRNYLLDHGTSITGVGWVVDFTVEFRDPQEVSTSDGTTYLCRAIGFKVERVCEKYERLVGISGTGFFDWNKRQATIPPHTQIRTDTVPLDFSKWKPRTESPNRPAGFLELRLEATVLQFERVPDAIDLEVL